MVVRNLLSTVTIILAISACTSSEESLDPGTMIEPPALAEVIGVDAISRAKAEEVYFRCTKVPRPERRGNAWCQLRERISQCKSSRC